MLEEDYLELIDLYRQYFAKFIKFEDLVELSRAGVVALPYEYIGFIVPNELLWKI